MKNLCVWRLLSNFRGDSLGVGVAPADLVALGSGAELALLAFGGSFESAAATHFLENAFSIEFGFKSLESPVNGFAFLQSHSTHASFVGCLVGPVRAGARFIGKLDPLVKADRRGK